MLGSSLDVTTADGVADSYLVLPEGEPRGAVLFFIDAFGLRQRIFEMADRIAGEGYAVLAPNVFYRRGRAPVLPMPEPTDGEGREAFFAEVKPLMAELGPEAMAARRRRLSRPARRARARAGGDQRLLHGRPARLAGRGGATRAGRGARRLPHRRPRQRCRRQPAPLRRRARLTSSTSASPTRTAA